MQDGTTYRQGSRIVTGNQQLSAQHSRYGGKGGRNRTQPAHRRIHALRIPREYPYNEWVTWVTFLNVCLTYRSSRFGFAEREWGA